jgi:membrane protein DedA with SNARE-associated domain
LICKLLPGIRAFGSFPAGMAEMRFRVFFGYTLLGAALWSVAFSALGYVLGRNWTVLALYLRPFSVLLIALGLLVLGLWLWSHLRSARHA